MTHLRNDYAGILAEKRVRYLPSCLIVEMLTKLYSRIAAVNISESRAVAPGLLVLLRRMHHNLRVTAEAYGQGRIRFFIGDWRDDRLRARRLFFNIMSSLGYISEVLERAERNMLLAAIEDVTAEWTALDRLMGAAPEERRAGGVCGSLCDCNSAAWRRAMASCLAALRDEAGGDPADCLILLCYGRARQQLVSAVEDALRASGSARRLDRDRILSVSRDDMSAVCRKCSESEYAGSSAARGLARGTGKERRRSAVRRKMPDAAPGTRRRALSPSRAPLSAVCPERRAEPCR